MVNDLLSSFTAQPVVAVAIVVGIVVIALARFTNSLESLRKFLQSDSATEHWFFGWVIEGVNRRVGSLIILQLIFGCAIYPIVILYSLQSMTIPGNGLYVISGIKTSQNHRFKTGQ